MLACPPGQGDGHCPLGFFGRGLQVPSPTHQRGFEPPRQCRQQPFLLFSPTGSHERGKIRSSHPLRKGNLVCASRRDCLLKASHSWVPLPASRRRRQHPCSPRFPLFSKEDRQIAARDYWFSRVPGSRHRVGRTGTPAPTGPCAAPRRRCAGSLARPYPCTRLLSGYRAGAQTGTEMQGFKTAFLFSFF